MSRFPCLLLDVGNTRLRWALLSGPDSGQDGVAQGDGCPEAARSIRHGGAVPLDLIATWDGLAPPARVLMANVGGAAVGAALARALRALWGAEIETATTRAEGFGVRIAYAVPERLGVDRWLALVAARTWMQRHRHPGPCLILDAGSAVTCDALLADGRHLGGLILPGIGSMRAALLGDTAIPPPGPLPEPAPAAPGGPWATDTAAAVAAGPIQALAALAERLYDRLAGDSGGPPTLLLTGGDGERLAPFVARPATHIPDLVLRGLECLALENP